MSVRPASWLFRYTGTSSSSPTLARTKLLWTGRVSGMAFGPDGKLYACQSGRRPIVRYTDAGAEEVVYADANCQDLATLRKGFYYTDPVTPGVWWSDYAGNRRKVDELTPAPV